MSTTQDDGTGTCCGRARQVVVLGGGASSGAALERCTLCARGQWRLQGRPVDRAEALAALGTAYREAPRAARAARDRAATARAARAASRAASAPVRPAGPAQQEDRREELGRLLQGWHVLGAAG